MFIPDGETPILADASIWAIWIVQILVVLAFVRALLVMRRINNPIYTGAFWACTVPMLYWDWIQNQPSQFRLIYDDRFIFAFRMTDGPGFGPGEPLIIAMAYAIHWIPLSWMIVRHNDWLSRKFGAFKWPAVFVFFLPQAIVEFFTVGWLKLYKYYMEPEFLTPWGTPWMNFPAAALIMTLTAWLLVMSQKFMTSFDAQSVAVNGTGQLSAKELKYVPHALGAMATTFGFYFGWCIYHNWWLWAQPWLGNSPWPH